MLMPAQTRRLRFGAFEVDVRACELRKHGLKIKLQDQPFQVLALLLERPGEMVSREELRQRLWPADTFVDFDVGLNNAIKRLRDALGDSTEIPRYVETLPRRGYRFIAPLINASLSEAESPQPAPKPTIEQQPSHTSEGAVTEVPALSGAHSRRMIWASAAVLLALLVLLVGLKGGGWRRMLLARATPVHISSLAVLPLENLSGDPAQEFLTDGMTDALITNLAQISSLRIISRTSVMRYKGTRKPLQEIARELNVDGIVEGTVTRSGDRVRVDAQLIEASTDRHTWARAYEREIGDVIRLQNEVAQAIASEIQVKLTPEEQARLARKETLDPQAYELYLRGRYFWNKRSKASVQKSIEYFQQAIQREPNYALAYAGIADAYIIRTDLPPQERFSKSKAAATTALQMDDGLAEAHNALAMSLYLYDWDWAGAEKEFQRALALNPNYATAHQWYGQYQRSMGSKNWAAEVQRAHELDPLSLIFAGGGWAVASGQYDLAIEIIHKKLELDPNFASGYVSLGDVYARKGMYREAIAQIQKGVNLSGGAPEDLSDLGYTYGVSGNRWEAVKILHQLMLLSERRYVRPFDIALVYVGLGEKDLAFDWLQKAVTDRSIPLIGLNSAETYGKTDSIRSDPRYAEMKRRIGLPQ
jgi:TolB-like protein/DNA-binding winged helix-turn-helix (wHTH) protein